MFNPTQSTIEALKQVAEQSSKIAQDIEEGKNVGDEISPKVQCCLKTELEIRTICYEFFGVLIPVIIRTVLLYPELFRAIAAFIRTAIPLIGIGVRIAKIITRIGNRVCHDKEVVTSFKACEEKVTQLQFKLMDDITK